MRIGVWIEAMRLRTLPVSVAGVIMGCCYAAASGSLIWSVALLCLGFAVLAQIASNFANEYFDYRDGLDRQGRQGPRRGVTEGDISPRAMLCAAICTLAAACIDGLCLIAYGGWWILPAGIVIALAALAYSAGPWPLSRHGLGEVAVVVFFGVIPVNLTCYLQTLEWSAMVAWGSVALGLMGANVLLVNNYRDRQDDAAVGKNTLAVIFGAGTAAALYLVNGIAAALIMMALASPSVHRYGVMAVTGGYLLIHFALWSALRSRQGAALNPLLGMTACLMLLYVMVWGLLLLL